jgi:hypothetical protein
MFRRLAVVLLNQIRQQERNQKQENRITNHKKNCFYSSQSNISNGQKNIQLKHKIYRPMAQEKTLKSRQKNDQKTMPKMMLKMLSKLALKNHLKIDLKLMLKFTFF